MKSTLIYASIQLEMIDITAHKIDFAALRAIDSIARLCDLDSQNDTRGNHILGSHLSSVG
jgi:hypothetical protein